MAMDMDIQMDEDMHIDDAPASHRLKGKGRQQLHDEKRTATLHRIRFLDYMPSSILAIALTPQTYDPAVHHPYLPSLHSGNGREILAVGRQNGEIYTWIGGDSSSSISKNKAKQDKGRGSITAPTTPANKQGWVLERVSFGITGQHADSVDHADRYTDIWTSEYPSYSVSLLPRHPE
jgi:hypothetical protein